MNAIDANIFAYAFDPAEPTKQAKARQLISRLVAKPDGTVLLWQAASEFLAYLRKAEGKGLLSADEVKRSFRDVLQLFPLQLPAANVFEQSFKLHDRYSLSHWDSMLVAACHEGGINLLYSEDMQNGMDYDGVKIVSPFV